MEHFDVIIVGAGLSGIGAARQLQDKCPGRSFLILEAREAIGGTWDLFRYPGIRSDSDMYTMGYDSKPWLNPKAIADGPSILSYIREAAVERGIDARNIQAIGCCRIKPNDACGERVEESERRADGLFVEVEHGDCEPRA